MKNKVIRYYIFKDGTMKAATATKEEAIELIHTYQALETHPILKAEFSYIKGTEEFVKYKREAGGQTK